MRGVALLLLTWGLLTGCTTLGSAAPTTNVTAPVASTTPIAEHTPTSTAAPIQPPDASQLIVPYVVEAPFATPTPFCEAAPTTRMIVRELGRVTSANEQRLNVRSGPSISNRAIGGLALNDTFLVLEGPACSDSYIWYRIRHDDIEGWIAEGDAAVYYIAPYLPG